MDKTLKFWVVFVVIIYLGCLIKIFEIITQNHTVFSVIVVIFGVFGLLAVETFTALKDAMR